VAVVGVVSNYNGHPDKSYLYIVISLMYPTVWVTPNRIKNTTGFVEYLYNIKQNKGKRNKVI
jgi:hypothetical protein